MLGFLYSGEYTLPELGSFGLNASHLAQLYVAAQMYQIDSLHQTVVQHLQMQLLQCQADLQLSWPRPYSTQDQMDTWLKSFQGFLEAIGTLLDRTSEDDVVRSCLFGLSWSSFMPIGQFRAPWVAFIKQYPEYVADVMAANLNGQYTYKLAREITTKAASVESDKKPTWPITNGFSVESYLGHEVWVPSHSATFGNVLWDDKRALQ